MTDPTAQPPTARAALRDRIAAALYAHSHPGWAIGYADLDQDERDTYLRRADAVLAVLPEPTAHAADTTVTPPPALTEAGRLRAQVEVLTRDTERCHGLATVGARCMREGHQGLIEQGSLVLEGWRFALAGALALDAEAPWEAIHERAKAQAAELTTTERTMLTFALEMAREEIYARSLEFTAEDRAALDSLRRLTAEARQGGEA